MKDMVEEMNYIHNKISKLRNKINDLERDIGSGNAVGRELRDSIFRERAEKLAEEYDVLIARLKGLVKP